MVIKKRYAKRKRTTKRAGKWKRRYPRKRRTRKKRSVSRSHSSSKAGGRYGRYFTGTRRPRTYRTSYVAGTKRRAYDSGSSTWKKLAVAAGVGAATAMTSMNMPAPRDPLSYMEQGFANPMIPGDFLD